MAHHIVTLPGDGIGPEIMAPTIELLNAVGDFEFEEHLFGGASIDAHGVALTDEVLAACRAPTRSCWPPSAGRSGTPPTPEPRPEQGLLGLRKGLGLYANLRPVKPLPALYDASPLRRERIEGTDLLVVRELTGGIYFGEKTRTATARPTSAPTPPRRSSASPGSPSRPPARNVSSVDKANVLETSRLWREVVSDLHAREFPHIELEHVLVDNAAMQLVSAPTHFDTILTENMFGDILSDEAAMITGSIGMLPSASLGGDGPGDVRAGARLRAGHRRAGHRQPARDVPLRRDDAASRTRLGKRGGRCRIGGGARARGGLRTPDLGGGDGTERATKAVLDNL